MEINSFAFFNEIKYDLPYDVKPPILVACRLATPENCGNLIRLADTIGCDQVYFTNWTNGISESKIKKTAGKSIERVKYSFVSEDSLFDNLPAEYSIVGLETAIGSKNIYQCQLPKNMILIAGSEKCGIPMGIIEKCDNVVHIPLTGQCTSLNVTHAIGIALFEWLRQTLR